MQNSLSYNVTDSMNKIWCRIPRKIKATFFSCFAMGLITHAFMLTNKLPNHDDITQTFDDLSFTVSSGRWFTVFPASISSTFSMPWVNGILCIIYISVAACFVVSLLKINRIIYCALISGIMVSFPVVAATLTYMQSADPYFFSLMLACFGAFLAGRYKFGYLYAILPLTLSMGIYQSYFSAAAGLLIMILINEVLKDELPWKKTLFKGLRFLGTLGASMAAYFVMVKITTIGKGLTSYAGIDQMGSISLPDLPASIFRSYQFLIGFYLGNWRRVHYSFAGIIFAFSFLACAGLMVLWCVRKKLHKEPVKLIFLAALIILLPLSCNIVYVMNPNGPIHDLMIYGMALVPVFLLTVVDQFTIRNSQFTMKEREVKLHDADQHSIHQSKNKKWIPIAQNLSCWMITLTAVMCIFNYFITSNQVYFKQFFTYEKAYAQSVSLISRIQSVPGYTSKTVVVFVGNPIIKNQDGTPELNDIIVSGTKGIYGNYSYPQFLRKYLNFTQPVEWVENSTLGDPGIMGAINDAEISAILADMPQYPNDGSVAFIGDKIYVKFEYNPKN